MSDTGSSLHAMEVFSHPRWEDFDYTYVNSNPFGWFGNGWTENEVNKKVDVDYLNDENIDFPLAEKVVVNGNGHSVKRKWEEPVVTNGNGHVIKQREEVAV
jgi:hypothetical protein